MHQRDDRDIANLTDPFAASTPFTITDAEGVEITQTELPALLDPAEQAQAWMDFAEGLEGILWVATPTLDRMLYISPHAHAVLGRAQEDVLRRGSWLAWVHHDDRARVLAEVQRLVAGGRADVEYRVERSDGTLIWLHDRGFPVWDRQGRIARLAGIADDVTHRKAQSRKRIQRREQLLRKVLDLVPHQIFALDSDGRFLLANEATARSFDISLPDLIGRSVFDLVVDQPERRGRIEADLAQVVAGQELIGTEDQTIDAHGDQRFFSTSMVPLDLAGAATRGLLAVAVDVSEQRSAEAALRRRAFYDPLTSLPSRDLFVERLDHAIARAGRRGSTGFALLFMDLDSFKEVNDTLGHLVGDELLVSAANRIKSCVRPGDTVSRFGGDEFAVLLEQAGTAADARVVAARIHESMKQPFELAGERHVLSTSIGIALWDTRVTVAADLLRDADGAMYHAKSRGPGRTQLFSEHIRADALRQVRFRNEIRDGVGQGEFFLEYQPVVELSTGRLAGLEALARWRHPTRGLVGPGEFIRVAEEAALVASLERGLVREACGEVRRWLATHALDGVRVSLNISSRQLAESSFVPYMELTLREFDLDPRRFVVELTESSFIDNTAATRATLGGLRDLGILIALDDFGTGFSSLSHLTSFPIDILKIDRSFTSHIEQDDRRARIVAGTVGLAYDLGLVVTAEGVEIEAQRLFLADLRCEYAQGWLFDRALPAEVVDVRLRPGHRYRGGPGG